MNSDNIALEPDDMPHEQGPQQTETQTPQTLSKFISSHGGWIFSILLSAGSCAYALGSRDRDNEQMKEVIAGLKEQVASMERDGSSYAKATRAMVANQSVLVDELRVDYKEARRDISDMKSDLRYVVEWVRDQKEDRRKQ